MILRIPLYTFTDLNADSDGLESYLEIRWAYGEIESAYLCAGTAASNVTVELAWTLLGGREVGARLIRGLIAEERMAS